MEKYLTPRARPSPPAPRCTTISSMRPSGEARRRPGRQRRTARAMPQRLPSRGPSRAEDAAVPQAAEGDKRCPGQGLLGKPCWAGPPGTAPSPRGDAAGLSSWAGARAALRGAVGSAENGPKEGERRRQRPRAAPRGDHRRRFVEISSSVAGWAVGAGGGPGGAARCRAPARPRRMPQFTFACFCGLRGSCETKRKKDEAGAEQETAV
ncbi:bladder cancer associated transcript 1 [Struthio camelus]|uniref:bladder cancer associated transcript 1 n=1 Tax=Struthio camelus TaxID=8801 RepID=UPI0036041282